MAHPARILIVDDMPTVRLILRNMLLESGFSKIFEAEDGDSAWRQIREGYVEAPRGSFDLIICDWNMPMMSGIDLLRAVRGFTQSARLPFLVVTSEPTGDRIEEVQRAGASGLVIKPFSREELALQVRAAIAV